MVLYKRVAVGGTFDKFHYGHRKLIGTAFEIGENVEIGVTSSVFANKNHKVDSCANRMANLNEFLKSKHDNYHISRLDDPYGPTIHEDDYDAIVVSEETEPTAIKINEIRVSKGMKPLDAIDRYSFEYRYRVSPDKKTILAINSNGHIAFGYRRSNYMEFAPEYEVTLKSGDFSYNPYLSWKDKLDIDVKLGQYALTKDGRTIIVDEIIEKGKLYRGRDIDKEELPDVELKHAEIHIISDERFD